jgi:hypothetical protein
MFTFRSDPILFRRGSKWHIRVMDEEDYKSEQGDRASRAKGSVNKKLADLEDSNSVLLSTNNALVSELSRVTAKLEGMTEAFKTLKKNQEDILSLLKGMKIAQDQSSMVGMIKSAVGAN